jgi:hypothetical protein
MGRNRTAQALARCHGFLALAADGELGEIQTPLFPPDWREPDYLIVRAAGPANKRRRRPVISVSLVEDVDEEQRTVYLRGTVRQLAHMPEALPLAGRRGGRRELRLSS